MGRHADMSCLPLRECLESCYHNLILCNAPSEQDRGRCPKWSQDGPKMAPRCALRASWGPLGASWGAPGASWGPLGSLLGASWGHLGASAGVLLTKAKIGYFRLRYGCVSEPSWDQLRVILGPSWGRLGAMLGPCWAHLGPSWAILGDLKRS